MERYTLISWFTHSVIPSICGWYAVDNAEFIPSCFINSRNAFDANCGPLSEMILSGNPNRLYKISSKSLAVLLDVIVLLQGMSITPLLRP